MVSKEARAENGRPSVGIGSRPHIVLFAPNSTDLLEGKASGLFGGAELQCALLASALSGHAKTSVITERPIDTRGIGADCVPLFTLRPPKRRWLIEFPRYVFAVYRAVRRFRGAVVVQRCSGIPTFIVAVATRLTGNHFVYHWAGECDIRGDHIAPQPWGGLIYRMGRALAHGQIVQTQEEEHRARGPSVSRVPNMVDTTVKWRDAMGSSVLWVGTIKSQFKQADMVLGLAKELPHRHFVVAGRFGSETSFNTRFKEEAARLPNVELLGHVPRERLSEVYANARCLVNTSSSEGFSNTFLEAISSRLPIVSLSHNPDDLLGTGGIGIAADGDFDALVQGIEAMFDESTWTQFKKSCERLLPRYQPASVAKAFAVACEKIGRRGPQ